MYKETRVGNDLTPTERDRERKLYEEAKELQVNSQGKAQFRVRGPPWNRKIVMLPIQDA